MDKMSLLYHVFLIIRDFIQNKRIPLVFYHKDANFDPQINLIPDGMSSGEQDCVIELFFQNHQD